MKIEKRIVVFLFCILTLFAFHSFASATRLTLEDRVAAQKAIEAVYWRHTIWPAENTQPKPSLAEVMSDKDIRLKVIKYLQVSDAFDSRFKKPITAAILQAEMNRMARETKDPELLREVWSALGNDPSIVAECFARQVLTERIADRHPALVNAISRSEWDRPLPSYGYKLPDIVEKAEIPLSAVQPLAVATAPSRRFNHTAVWTGTVMIVWGGWDNLAATAFTNTGGRYTPSTNSWASTSTTNAPAPRRSHSAVWTGSRMIVWGGTASALLNTGGSYNPSTNSWTTITSTNAPSARFQHTAVWSGSVMIVWGGFSSTNLNTGGRYSPSANSWTSTTTTGAPSARQNHTAVWTGSRMIVWGGKNSTSRLNTGGLYNPSTNSWTATTTTGAPSARELHSAVWTGKVMTVWGGGTTTGVNTGGRYDPLNNTWKSTTTSGAPSGRLGHTAIWTGSRMVAWGGYAGSALSTGGRYDPSTDSWNSTSTTSVPTSRKNHTAVWTGNVMIIWGGRDNNNVPLSTGSRYDPSTNIWKATAN